jgi:hypothetical protein
MNTNLDKLSAADLRHAADLSEKIEELQAELAQILSGKKKPGRKAGKKSAGKPGPKPGAKKKTAKKKGGARKLSAAARKAMSDARKAYWANKRKEAAAAPKTKGKK